MKTSEICFVLAGLIFIATCLETCLNCSFSRKEENRLINESNNAACFPELFVSYVYAGNDKFVICRPEPKSKKLSIKEIAK